MLLARTVEKTGERGRRGGWAFLISGLMRIGFGNLIFIDCGNVGMREYGQWEDLGSSELLVFMQREPHAVFLVSFWASRVRFLFESFYLEATVCRPLPCLRRLCLWWNGWKLNATERESHPWGRAVVTWLCSEVFQVCLETGQEPCCSNLWVGFLFFPSVACF